MKKKCNFFFFMNKHEAIALSGFRNYWKATVTRTMWYYFPK